jgi:hypothetical protein
MAVSGMTLTRRLFQWRLFLTLAVMAGLVLWFIVHRALRFTSFDAATYADYFWPRRFGLVPHITGGMVADPRRARPALARYDRPHRSPK